MSQTNLNRIKFVIEKNKRILTFAEAINEAQHQALQIK